jgi:hypothetical protein
MVEQFQSERTERTSGEGAAQSTAAHDEVNELRRQNGNGNGAGNQAGDNSGSLQDAHLEDDGSINFGDQNEQIIKPDGTRHKPEPPVEYDKLKRVVEVNYPNGTDREFGYGKDGELNRIEQPNGTVIMRLGDDVWVSVDKETGKIKVHDINDPKVDKQGNFSYTTDSGIRITHTADGKTYIGGMRVPEIPDGPKPPKPPKPWPNDRNPNGGGSGSGGSETPEQEQQDGATDNRRGPF